MFFRKEKKVFPLAVKGLSGGPRGLIKNITFRVRKRDIFGIVGLSGSGKTTLLKLILGLLKKKGGEVSFYGKPLWRSKRIIGFCPQGHSFFEELTVRENILLFGSLYGAKNPLGVGRKMLEELEMEEKLDELAGNLSGGQKTRLNVILSLLHEPKLIFMDEPFTGLDYYNRNLLWNFIKRLRKKGCTVILTTHLLDEAQKNCTKLLVLKEGRKFVYGDVEDIREKVGLDHVYEVRFKSLSKRGLREIIALCKEKKIDVLNVQIDTILFGVKEERKKVFLKLLKDYEHEVVSSRKPNINDLFLKVVSA